METDWPYHCDAKPIPSKESRQSNEVYAEPAHQPERHHQAQRQSKATTPEHDIHCYGDAGREKGPAYSRKPYRPQMHRSDYALMGSSEAVAAFVMPTATAIAATMPTTNPVTPPAAPAPAPAAPAPAAPAAPEPAVPAPPAD